MSKNRGFKIKKRFISLIASDERMHYLAISRHNHYIAGNTVQKRFSSDDTAPAVITS